MNSVVETLSEKEKEALRLLLGGHDAKSIARSLGLSVHTINERLRDARRKLGVGSSREAARMMAQAEGQDPQLLGDKHFGVTTARGSPHIERSDHRRDRARSLLWLSGGMLIMSLIIVAAMLSFEYTASRDRLGSTSRPIASAVAVSAQSPAAIAAQKWVRLLDVQRWDESWTAAGTLFRSQMAKDQWASTIKPVREPLGTASSRVVQRATRTTSLPGMPAGDYAVIEFKTEFVQRRGAVETVVMIREGTRWKVNGYFIR